MLLGVLPSGFDQESLVPSHVPRPSASRASTSTKAPARFKRRPHRMSHSPLGPKKAQNRKIGLPLEYLLQGATVDPLRAKQVFLDDRIDLLPTFWGWDAQCMPGFGRAAFSRPSAHFSRYSAIVKPDHIPRNLHDYRYSKTIFSNATGEHWKIGIDVGLSVWSCLPIYSMNTGKITDIAFVATPPIGQRRPYERAQLKNDFSNATLPPKVLSSRKKMNTKNNYLVEEYDFECLLYTSAGKKTIFSNVSVSEANGVIVATCNIENVEPSIVKNLLNDTSQHVTLALHDKKLDLFWNFSKPCTSKRVSTMNQNIPLDRVISDKSYWKEPIQFINRTLTAVLIVEREKNCFVENWLEHTLSLGFEHVYVYKQVVYGDQVDDLDRLLWKYVQKSQITVIPFFNARFGCNHKDPNRLRYECQDHTHGYLPLYQDAILRFRSSWTLISNANEIIVVPGRSEAEEPNSKSLQNMASTLLSRLDKAYESTKAQKTKIFSLSGFSFGTGKKQGPEPYCPSGMASSNNRAKGRSVDVVNTNKWFLKTETPTIISPDSMTSLNPELIRLDRHLKQYQGALPQNNVVEV